VEDLEDRLHRDRIDHGVELLLVVRPPMPIRGSTTLLAATPRAQDRARPLLREDQDRGQVRVRLEGHTPAPRRTRLGGRTGVGEGEERPRRMRRPRGKACFGGLGSSWGCYWRWWLSVEG
jgi:hypothetical protein